MKRLAFILAAATLLASPAFAVGKTVYVAFQLVTPGTMDGFLKSN